MTKTCPHCNYARKLKDETPEWQCPSCLRAYDKVPNEGGMPLMPTRESGGRLRFVLLNLLLIGVIGYFVWQRQHDAAEAAKIPELPEITVFVSENCGDCRPLRDLLDDNDIAYTLRDIDRSSAEFNDREKYGGGHSVPFVVIGDETYTGYREQEMRNRLAPWLKRSP